MVDEQDLMEAEQVLKGQVDPNAYSAILQDKKVSNIIDQINPERILIDVDHRLKGQIKNPSTGIWEQLTQQVVTDKLRYSILNVLNSLFTQNTTLGNLDDKMINNIMANLIESLRDDLEENAVEYGLQGRYAEMTRICDIVCYLVFTLLTRAHNGMESKKLFNALSIKEGMNIAPEKTGIMDKFKVW